MTKKTRFRGLIDCGFTMAPQNIDSRMWDEGFTKLAKCPACRFRLDFFATNHSYQPKRGGRDIGDTWDNALIVSDRFREICRRNRLEGFEFRPVGLDNVFHAVPTRFVSVDPKDSEFEYHALCERCGNPEWFVTRGNPMVLSMNEPLADGFWATNIFLGSGNTKGPSIIVNRRTLSVLRESELKGTIRFEPVYAVRSPQLEAALKRIPKTNVIKVRASKKTQPGRLRLRPFLDLLSEPAPAFCCCAVRDKKRVTVIRIQHDMGDAPTKAVLAAARQILGRAGKLVIDFYKYRDGTNLYRGVGSDEPAICLFPIGRWKLETVAMKKMFASRPRKERPEVVEHAVAFGEQPQSGHHFAIVTKGERSGSILLTNHETLSADEFAADFNEFLKTICTDPVDLLVNQLGGYTRYRDNKTEHEWIPTEYLADCRRGKLSQRRGRRVAQTKVRP